jgi:hypothetical protein
MSSDLPQQRNQVVLFENIEVRRTWHEEQWYFSVVDVVGILTESDPVFLICAPLLCSFLLHLTNCNWIIPLALLHVNTYNNFFLLILEKHCVICISLHARGINGRYSFKNRRYYEEARNKQGDAVFVEKEKTISKGNKNRQKVAVERI